LGRSRSTIVYFTRERHPFQGEGAKISAGNFQSSTSRQHFPFESKTGDLFCANRPDFQKFEKFGEILPSSPFRFLTFHRKTGKMENVFFYS